MQLRSWYITKGIHRAPHRSYFKALGLLDRDIEKPLIAVVNTWNEVSVPNAHLRSLAEAVKGGIWAAGGTPLEFNTIAISDSLAMIHEGMRYVLPSREVIVDSIEVMVESQLLDGMVLVASGDKPVPACLMAMARLDLPAVMIDGGCMLPGRFKGRDISFTEVVESPGAYKAGKLTEDEVRELEGRGLTSAGGGASMYTPATMAIMGEVLGLALPYSSTIPSMESRRLRAARESGYLAVELVRKGFSVRKIITRKSFENAIRVGMAVGASTNYVLHLMAMASEAGIDLSLDLFHELGLTTPYLCPIDPSGRYHINDLDAAGGIPAVMKELAPLLHLGEMTVTGKTVGECIASAQVYDRNVIHSLDDPVGKEGGICILRGNLAPEGAVVKQSAVAPSMRHHKGSARVFDNEEDAIKATYAGDVAHGDIIVIRFEGPKGGPGMKEMLGITSTLVGLGMGETVSVITDGRFSGASRGAFAGHICPEAAEGGPIAAVRDGDLIEIDIPSRSLTLLVSHSEIQARLASMPPWEPRVKTGVLAKYAALVGPASKGAVLGPRRS
jgi:dihydroxy-acid dehydratase